MTLVIWKDPSGHIEEKELRGNLWGQTEQTDQETIAIIQVGDDDDLIQGSEVTVGMKKDKRTRKRTRKKRDVLIHDRDITQPLCRITKNHLQGF